MRRIYCGIQTWLRNMLKRRSSLSGIITNIKFKNYKKLRNFSVRAQSGNVFVGPNNSGKSSILDAFRLLEACLRYTKSRRPILLDTVDGVFDGYQVPETASPFHLANAITNYGDEDACIDFTHSNGATAHIRLATDRTLRFFIDSNGRRFSTSKQFRDAFPVDLIVVPTLAPLESEEVLLQAETVRRNRATRLAARSFRNIWHLEDAETFAAFKQRVERAWPGVKLLPPELVREIPPRVEMYFEEDRVTREIQWAGFGFQVWLQIHTQLIRGAENSILVLDEPDIYLHPDLQHRLYTDIKELFNQYFLATHATEIINVADTSELLIVEPESRSAKRIKRDAEYGEMLNYIGSAENADFAKIARVKKVLFVEGQDAKLLRRFAKKLQFERLASEQDSPVYTLGGFTQWKRAETTIWAFKNLLNIDVDMLCLFDRDYRSDEEVEHFTRYMAARGLQCIVLRRKEIENYLLSPPAIARSVAIRLRQAGKDENRVSECAITDLIVAIGRDLKHLTSAQVASNAMRFAREQKSGEDDATIISKALAKFDAEWAEFDGLCRLAPGKDLLKRVFDGIQDSFGVSISVALIQEHIKAEEIDVEVSGFVSMLNDFFRAQRVSTISKLQPKVQPPAQSQ